MSLWAGATQYLRVMEGRREIWVAQGHTLQDPYFCWKVKCDPVTNRYFFVNMAGLGKKWRLPDIYDPSYAAAHKEVPAPRGGPSSAAGHPSASHSSRGAERRLQSGAKGGGSGTPSVDDGTKKNRYPDLDIFEDPQKQTQNAQRNDGAEAEVEDAGHVEIPSWIAASSATNKQHHQPIELPPPLEDDDPYSATATREVIGYGDDAEWSNLSPLRQMERQREREEEDRIRDEKERMEREILEEMATRAPLATSPDALMRGTPATDDVREHISPRRAQLLADLEEEHARMDIEVRQRVSSLARDANAVEEERTRCDMLHRQQMAVTASLEAQHMELIASHGNDLMERIEQQRRGGSPPMTTVASPGNDNTNSPSARAGWEVAARSPSPQHQQQHYLSPTGVDPMAIVQNQLEHERRRNDTLTQALEEKERLLTETRLNDSRRERREIGLRVRMLEAMVAYRHRVGVLKAEQQSVQDHRVERKALAGILGSSSPGGTRHPLMEAEFDLGDDIDF